MQIINLEQGTEASESPALLGLSLWAPRTPLQLFEIQTGLKAIGARYKEISHHAPSNFNSWTIIVVAALLMMFSLTARAGAAELTTYRCRYERYPDGETIRKVKEPFEMIFVAEHAAKRATTTGNNGSATVFVSLGKAGEGVSFVEVTPAGNVMTTVVDSKGSSIHSRHTIMAGQVVPSQFYGRCQRGDANSALPEPGAQCLEAGAVFFLQICRHPSTSGANGAPKSAAAFSIRPSSGSHISSASWIAAATSFSVSQVMPRPPSARARGPEADR